jgi:fructan beta-fructosidase
VAERLRTDADGARPLVHFTPPTGWANDPNGLVHLDGEWHLCYQHHPHSVDWGPMHWGHAVSTDLLSWTHLPVALMPDRNGTIYSGSAVLDRAGTAGLGGGALVACYTQHTPRTEVQSVAASTDRGRTWHPLPGNPVLRPPSGVPHFRDPKLVRYDDGARGHWVMVLAVGDGAWLYTSDDLLHWEPATRFHPEVGRPNGVWECPDLFPLAVDGSGRRRWVLVAGAIEAAPAGGSGTRYWTGDFDGVTFHPDGPARWVDHGPDCYAVQSWSDVPDGRRVWLGWMSNWAYAARVPAGAWRGRMTLPRTVALTDGDAGPALSQRPVAELAAWLGAPAPLGAAPLPLTGGAGLLRLAVDADGRLAVAVDGSRGHARVAYDGSTRTLTVRRDGTAATAVGPGFTLVCAAAVPPTPDGRVDVNVLVDRGSVEVFAAGGRVALTALVPGLGACRVAVTGDGIDRALVRPVTPPGVDGAG